MKPVLTISSPAVMPNLFRHRTILRLSTNPLATLKQVQGDETLFLQFYCVFK